jgi:hypothetical protein
MEHANTILSTALSTVALLAAQLLDLNLVLVLVGVAVLVLALSVGVVLLSRQLAARREADLHRDLQEQRHDIERREHRLAERERRLDDEAKRLQDEAARLDSRATELSGVEEERRLVLERAASLTAEEAKNLLVSAFEQVE